MFVKRPVKPNMFQMCEFSFIKKIKKDLAYSGHVTFLVVETHLLFLLRVANRQSLFEIQW